MKHEEKLELVRAESELRPGMIVVVKPCLDCAQTHRAMLLSRRTKKTVTKNTGTVSFVSWKCAPRPQCEDRDYYWAFDVTIDQGRLYRVIDGLERGAETTKDREMERVR